VLDLDGQNLVAFPDGIDHIYVLGFTEYSVAAIEVWLGGVANKELAAIGVGPSVGHREATSLMLVLVDLTVDFVTGATGTSTLGAATLDHEVVDHSMEIQAIVKALFGQIYKVLDGVGGICIEKLDVDNAFVCSHNGASHSL
jgi:hypothetical protein